MQYIIREIPNHWSVAKLYFPKYEYDEYKAIEIVFAQTQKPIRIEFELSKDMRGKYIDLYYADGKGNLSKCKYKKVNDLICLSTNRVGVYVLIERKRNAFLFSKVNTRKIWRFN